MILQSFRNTVLAGLAAALPMPIAAIAETKILYNIFVPPTHFYWGVMRDWADQVHEASDGRLVIEFSAKSVAPPPRVMDAVRKGAADAGFIANIFLSPKNPGAHVGLMPAVHLGDSEATSVALWNTYQKYFAEHEKWPGVEVLGMYHFASGVFCSLTDTPITSVADLQSRKVWTVPGNMAKIFANMGVSVVTSPAVQLHEMVSRNVVEAYAGITYDSVINFKAGPYTKSCTEFEKAPFSINFTHFVNARTWKRLSDEDKQVLRDLSGEHLARMVGKKVNSQLAKAREELSATVAYLPAPDELVSAVEAAAAPVVDEWLEKVGDMGVNGQEALEYMRAETARLTAENAM